MRKRNLTVNLAAAVTLLAAVTAASGQTTNPRFGVWKLKSDAPPPTINIMTYEPYGDGGMSITVESTNSTGRESKWSYVTMFDGVFRPVTGREGAETAVEIVDDQNHEDLQQEGRSGLSGDHQRALRRRKHHQQRVCALGRERQHRTHNSCGLRA